jgi:hypothetical protein
VLLNSLSAILARNNEHEKKAIGISQGHCPHGSTPGTLEALIKLIVLKVAVIL